MSEIILKAHQFTEVLGFPITDSFMTMIFGSILLIVLVLIFSSSFALIPGKFQMLTEDLVDGVRNYTIDTLENEKVGKKVYPLIITIFVFILFFNLIKFIPGFEVLKFGDYHFFKSLHSDLNMTIALAVVSFVVIQAFGISVLGFFKYGSKFINLKKPLSIPIGLIELVSEMSKLISLSFRLFGNILAGTIIMLILEEISHLGLPIPVMFFEIFVAVLQAAIFAMLTLFYIKLAISEPH
jgi:F-type H+-transporting ATPase subunit a